MIYVVVATEAMTLKTLFQNTSIIIETPDIEVSVVYEDFEVNLFYSKSFYENLFGGITNHPSFG